MSLLLLFKPSASGAPEVFITGRFSILPAGQTEHSTDVADYTISTLGQSGSSATEADYDAPTPRGQ